MIPMGVWAELQGENKQAVRYVRVPGYGMGVSFHKCNSSQGPGAHLYFLWVVGNCSELRMPLFQNCITLFWTPSEASQYTGSVLAEAEPKGLSQTHAAASLSGLPNIKTSFKALLLTSQVCYRKVQLKVHSEKSIQTL